MSLISTTGLKKIANVILIKKKTLVFYQCAWLPVSEEIILKHNNTCMTKALHIWLCLIFCSDGSVLRQTFAYRHWKPDQSDFIRQCIWNGSERTTKAQSRLKASEIKSFQRNIEDLLKMELWSHLYEGLQNNNIRQ